MIDMDIATKNIFFFKVQSEKNLNELFKNQLEEPLRLQNQPLKYSIEELLRLGCFYINQKRVSDGQFFQNIPLHSGDIVRIHTNPKRFPKALEVQQDFSKLLIKETPDFILLNKPAGIPTHETLDNKIENLFYEALLFFNRPLYLTSRLDCDTQGLILFAKTKKFQQEWNTKLQAGQIKKIYLATSAHKIPEGVYTHYMLKSKRCPKKLFDSPLPNTLQCQLKVLSVSDNLNFHHGDKQTKIIYHHKVLLITGRTHQIRAQFQHLGAPLIGDSIYGDKTHPGLETLDNLQKSARESTFSKKLGLECIELWDKEFKIGSL